LPRIVSFDLFLASSAVNALISLVVMGAVFLSLWLYGISQAKPVSIADCGYALAMLMLLAVGVGLINTAIARFVPFWLTLFGYATRGLLFVSGVIHMPEMLTVGIRHWISWNPIMHGIEWFRVGLYGRYPALLLDQSYLVKCVVIVLFIGMIADRATLRYAGR
jgi:capsular polysaccharide transport system permease protein